MRDFNIPYSFRTDHENYITLPPLRLFVDTHIKSQDPVSLLSRFDLIEKIERFARQNDINYEITCKWLDNVLKQGMKLLVMKKIYIPDKLRSMDLTSLDKLINDRFFECTNEHISEYKHKASLSLIKYKPCGNADKIGKLSFVFSILLIDHQDKTKLTGESVIYPIFVDLDLEKNLIVGRAKSKVSLYKRFPETNDDTVHVNLSVKSRDLIQECMYKIIEVLDLNAEERFKAENIFKKTIFNLLEEFTVTPAAIKGKMDSVNSEVDDFIKTVFQKLSISEHYNYDHAFQDLIIFAEKYISINYEDKSVFQNDRDAFPIRITSTDDELTKIDETTSNFEPLQQKEAFFDSKKTIFRNGLCEKIHLCHKRSPKKYYTNDPFTLSIEQNRDSLFINFKKYVEEEDIQNVLSRISKYTNL